MPDKESLQCRHYATYTGVSLPLKLITPLADDDLERCITYFRGYYDSDDRLLMLEKVVYGEIEFEHRYEYNADGNIRRAELCEQDEEPRVMEFA